MKILIDAMGGDNAPLEIILGAIAARDEFDVGIALVGREDVICRLAEEQKLNLDGIEIFHAEDAIAMDDNPLDVRRKADCSIRVGMEMLARGEVDAFVGAGSTGAMHLGSTLYVRRISGIHRSAIATIIPLSTPMLLLDSGANTVVTPEHLVQFALMGSVYMKNIFNIERPRIGLLNNGTERTKGTELHIATYDLLNEHPHINFVGNIEGKQVPFDKCDVLVTDGFCGNILLKTIEGTASFVLKKVRGVFMQNVFTKAGAVMYKASFGRIKKEFDATEYGGAPFLGIKHPVIKAQGSSNAKAIKSAVKQAISYVETGLIDEIATLNSSVE